MQRHDEILQRIRELKQERTRQGIISDAYKLCCNSIFGKLNDKYSPLRSVPSAMRVTLNGQLFILMFVERLAALGCEIVSANTDGVTVRIKREDVGRLNTTSKEWEDATKMELEQVEYSRIFRRDINNYLAITIDGKVKYKGAIASDGGKGDGRIVKKAAERYLLDGVPPDVTIDDETDITSFLYYIRSKNGGELYHGDVKYGKSLRWYAATAETGKPVKRLNPATKARKENWAFMPHGHCAGVALDVSTWTMANMVDLDRDYYVAQAWKLIEEIGPGKQLTTEKT